MCGFYALPQFTSALDWLRENTRSNCVGAVLLYGRRYVHEDEVMRSQFCDIVAVAVIQSILVKYGKPMLTESSVHRMRELLGINVELFEEATPTEAVCGSVSPQ